MNIRFALCLAGAWVVFVPIAAAADPTWQIKYSPPLVGQLGEVFGPLAFLVNRQTTLLVPVDKLDDAGVARVGDFLATREQRAPEKWSNSTSPVVTGLRRRLQRLEDGKLVPYDPGEAPVPEFFLVYFSAHWCGPCRRYTPGLVANYNRLREKHPGLFELVFMSSDESAGDQAKYAREAAMPWPVVKFSAVSSVKTLTRWGGRGIPCLILLSRSGDLIAHSYQGEEYVGPDEVWKQFEGMVALMDPKNQEARRILHPVAVRRHVAAAKGAARPAEGYQIVFDPKPYRGLSQPALTVVAEVDGSGAVTSATTEPELPMVDALQFSRDATAWLFLPEVEGGQGKASTVRFRLNLSTE